MTTLEDIRRRNRAITVLDWKPSALPGCFGWPCLKAEYGSKVVRIWQGSPLTTRGQWLYALDDDAGRPGPITCVRGNRGTVKVAAGHALLRASRMT